jgi:hypothetical protein
LNPGNPIQGLSESCLSLYIAFFMSVVMYITWNLRWSCSCTDLSLFNKGQPSIMEKFLHNSEVWHRSNFNTVHNSRKSSSYSKNLSNIINFPPVTSSIILITCLFFKQSGWYLNVSTWFIENILFEQKGIKLSNKWHLWKIKQWICNIHYKGSKFTCCPNI